MIQVNDQELSEMMRGETMRYEITENSMMMNGREDVSDEFFGSERPSSYDTDEKRRGAIQFWIDEGWMHHGDVVEWDGVRYELKRLLGLTIII